MTDRKISTGPNARPKNVPIAGTASGIPDEALAPGEELPTPPTDEEVADAKRALGVTAKEGRDASPPPAIRSS